MHDPDRFGWPGPGSVLRCSGMRLRTRTIERRHLVPRCLACGAEQVMQHAGGCCAGCGEDLDARPARSYAEMEGLVEADSPEPASQAFARWRQRVTLERWVLTGFTAAVTLALLMHAVGSLWG